MLGYMNIFYCKKPHLFGGEWQAAKAGHCAGLKTLQELSERVEAVRPPPLASPVLRFSLLQTA